MGSVPHQRVLEGVAGLRGRAAAKDQLGGGEPVQGGLQLGFGQRRDRREERVGELAPDAGRDLRHLLDPRHPVQPGHERGMQRGGHCRPWSRRPGLQHRLGQLLDEQRHPVGPGRDLAQHLGRQAPATGQARDDRLGRAAAEAVEREPRHVRVPAQGRLVVRPARQQHQRPRARDPVKGLAEELEGGGVDPVRVLEHHQHRSATREPEELLDQHGQRAGTPLLRGEVLRRVACTGVHPEQRRDQRRRLADVLHALAQQRLELVELRRLGVGGREAGGEAELLGHRPKRRAGVMGRALVAERDVLVAQQSRRAWPGPAGTCRCRPRRPGAPPGPRRPQPAASARARAPAPGRARPWAAAGPIAGLRSGCRRRARRGPGSRSRGGRSP